MRDALPSVTVSGWLERRASLLDEHRRKRGSVSSGFRLGGPAVAGRPMATVLPRTMAERFVGLARGGQPCVVKLISYGGSSRIGSLSSYISRDGELALENEWGKRLTGKGSLSGLSGEWGHLLSDRADSRDIGVFRAELNVNVALRSDVSDAHEVVRDVLAAAYGGRKFAYGIVEGEAGLVRVEGLVMLRHADGSRLTGDAKANEFVSANYAASEMAGEIAAKFRFTGHGNGVEFGSSRLRGLVETYNGQVRDQGGKMIANETEANRLMQREWRGDLHSRKARDVMHVMVSARAGTDVDQFKLAAREFLSKQFGGHRYVWAVHDPADDPKDAQDGGKRPHVHAHAMITMRSDYGDRARPTIETFRQWRRGMAEAARNNGIAMEMTDRRDLASAPAFTKSHVRPSYRRPEHEQPVSDEQAENSRTRHVGTSEAAQVRYEHKRSERPTYPTTDNSRAYVESARQQWQVMATAAVDERVASFADKLNERLNMAQMDAHGAHATSNKSSGTASNPAGSTVVRLTEAHSAEEMTRPISRDVFNAYEARATAELKRASETIGPEHRDAFDKTSKAVYRLIETRRSIVEMHEALEKGGVNAPAASAKEEPSTTPSAGSSVPPPSRSGDRGAIHGRGVEVDEADVHATRAMAGRSGAQGPAPQTKTEATKPDKKVKAEADKSGATRNDNSELAKVSGRKTSRDKDDFEMG